MAAFGPGVDRDFPSDPSLLPYLTLEQAGMQGDNKAPTYVTPDLVKDARLIATPDERSLALRRIANAAIVCDQLTLAHHTLEEAVTATSKVSIPLVQDQRLIEIVTSLTTLADALTLIGREALKTAAPLEPEGALPQASSERRDDDRPLPQLKEPGNQELVDQCADSLTHGDLQRALEQLRTLQRKFESDQTADSEKKALQEHLTRLTRKFDHEAADQFARNLNHGDFKKAGELLQTLQKKLEAIKISDAENKATKVHLTRMVTKLDDVVFRLSRLEWQRAAYLAAIIGNPTYRNELLYRVADSEASGSASIANALLTTTDLGSRTTPQPLTNTERSDSVSKAADSILVESSQVAKRIDRLIWKYRAMIRIALQAADSQQYTRGVELARGIENGEARAEAMLLLAESQCRHNQNEAATATYEQAAQAVGTVDQEGLRGVLAGFLIESMIATGRFEDARACIVLYPEQSLRLVALGAVAESQGRRGAAESARRWIAREVPEEHRPALYRRVTTGVLAAVEDSRRAELMRDQKPPER